MGEIEDENEKEDKEKKENNDKENDKVTDVIPPVYMVIGAEQALKVIDKFKYLT